MTPEELGEGHSAWNVVGGPEDAADGLRLAGTGGAAVADVDAEKLGCRFKLVVMEVRLLLEMHLWLGARIKSICQSG